MNNCLQCNITRMLDLYDRFVDKKIEFDGIKIKAYIDNRHDGNWLKNYFFPYYAIQGNEVKTNWKIYSIIDSRYYEELTRFIKLKGLNTGSKKTGMEVRHSFDEDHFFVSARINEGKKKEYSYLFFNLKSKEVVLVSREYCREIDYFLARNIRTIFNLSSLLRGDLHLHASAAAVLDKGCIFAGNKNQGKTLSVLAACLGRNSKYISNDHLIVVNKKKFHGSPTSVGVRYETLRQIPGLSKYLKDKRPDYIFQEQNRKDKKRYFLVSELAKAIKTRVAGQAAPKAIFIPQQSMEKIVWLESIDKEKFIDMVNDLVIDDPCEHAPIWREYFLNDLNALKRKRLKILDDLFVLLPLFKINFNNKNFQFIPKELERLGSQNDKKYLYAKAKEYAKIKYGGIIRKDGRTMFSHVDEVVKILKKHGISDMELLTVGYLHDIFEATNVTEKEILINFNNAILKKVLSLTIIKKPKENYESEIKRMSSKLKAADRGVALIKLADRLHNLNCMAQNKSCFEKKKVERYKMSTEKMVREILDKKAGCKKLVNEVLYLCKK